MGVSIGAEGYVGIAIETTSGTYEAPDKFFPLRSESLSWTQNTNWRRVIRGTADPIGAVAGNGNVEGDLDMELLSNVVPYFLLCARGTVDKTDDTGTYTYVFTPSHGALAPNTMSITIVRSGEAFGYVGCVVNSMSFGVDNDMATVNFSMLGMREESVSVPASPVYEDDDPYGSGTWNIQVPTDTQVFDSDNFTFDVDDGGEVQNRLKDELGAQFISFGERTTTISIDRDFEDRSEMDEFKNLTSKSITVNVGLDADNQVSMVMPVAYVDSYDVNLGDVGSLVRSSVSYQGTHDSDTGGSYEIEVITTEDVTIPGA